MISSSRVKSLLCTMDEPPAQVPRHTTSLTRLWRRHDLADSVTKFLPTQALAMLPNLSRSFEQDKFRMLLVAMRGSGAAAACTGALLSTLQTSGRDAGHHRTVWGDQKAAGWFLGHRIDRSSVRMQHIHFEGGDTEDEHFLGMERTGEYDRQKGIDFHNKLISRSCPSGQRRCVRRLRFVFAYEGATDAWDNGLGMVFALRGPASDVGSRTILKFYTRLSTSGLRIVCAGGDENTTLLTVPKSRIASQHTDCFETVTIDAELNWNLQRAEVRATTRDGTEYRKTIAFQRLPLRGLKMLFFGPGVHLLGDIDVWYCDMPTPTARCRLPFAPCRDDELRFDVGPGLGSGHLTHFLLGGAPLGMPPPDESDDADY